MSAHFVFCCLFLTYNFERRLEQNCLTGTIMCVAVIMMLRWLVMSCMSTFQ